MFFVTLEEQVAVEQLLLKVLHIFVTKCFLGIRSLYSKVRWLYSVLMVCCNSIL